jgi:hypothetical protein
MEVHYGTIPKAIERAKNSKKWARCDDISVDAAFLILRLIEKEFGRQEQRPQGKVLYQIVDRICYTTGLPQGRPRLYQLVCMRYYAIRKERKHQAEMLWKKRREEKLK